jgi:hypothetical protein
MLRVIGAVIWITPNRDRGRVSGAKQLDGRAACRRFACSAMFHLGTAVFAAKGRCSHLVVSQNS